MRLFLKCLSSRQGLVRAVACFLLAASQIDAAVTVDPVINEPDAERQSFKLADGWEINLFAAEPLVEKPVSMNWDAAGRLWVATSETYPQIAPGKTPNDKIIVLEDTKGVGQADKSTVYADGLLIPTSVAPGDGGCYVTNSTEVVQFRGANKSGKATERRVILDGFGTEDTHHIIHTLRWGIDGRLYFNQSIYIHSHVSTPWGLKTLLGSGMWRFDPSTMELDVFSRGLVNPWGNAWDRWGNTFQTDGAGGGGINYSFPGAGFDSAVGYERRLPGLNPGSPKYCGAEILSGRHIPDDFQGDILTSDFRADRMVRFKLGDAGAGFFSRQMPDFITSSDRAFRPVDIKMGPDGAIYIADWYNPIINHGEVDFRDPRRDHSHGRIWRVTAKGRPTVDRPTIAGAPITDLLNLYKNPEDYTAQQVRQELRARGAPSVLPELASWVRSIGSKDPQREHHLLEALWTYQTLDAVEPGLVSELLHAGDARARAPAVRVASHWAAELPKASDWFAEAVADENPRVRLEAVRALARVPAPESITIAARVLDKPMDPFLDYALWLTANDLKEIWLPAFSAGKLTGWAKPTHLTFVLGAVKSPAALSSLIAQLQSNQLPPESRGDVIDLIATIDPRGQAGVLLDLALSKDVSDGSTHLRLLSALRRIAAQEHVVPANNPGRIQSLFNAPDFQVRSQAIRLAGMWRLQQFQGQFGDLAQAPDTPPVVRSAAFDALASLGGDQVGDLLRKLSGSSSSPEIRSLAIGSLARLDVNDAAGRAADLLTSGAEGIDPAPLLSAFVAREGGADALVKALSGKKLPTDTARLALRYLQSLATTDMPLIDFVRQSIGLTSGPTKLSAEQMKQVVAEVMQKGDAARGEQIFRGRQTGCYQCHAIGGAGGWLAPDLRAIGASSPVDYLVDSVLDPNKAVKDGYTGYTIATKSGDVFSGIKVRQDAHTLVLRDNAHEEIPIPLSSIKRQKEVGSLMPTGLADTLTHAEFLDLIRFLSDLGKPGPYGPSTAQVVRRWRVMENPPSPANDTEAGQLPAFLAADQAGWTPDYSLVSGVLPIGGSGGASTPNVVYAECQIESTSPGKVALLLNSVAGLSTWLDGKRAKPGAQLMVDLAAGIHTLVFRVDPTARANQGLRVEVVDVAGSNGHARPVGGK